MPKTSSKNPSPAAPGLPPFDLPAAGIAPALGEMWKSLSGLSVPAADLAQVQADYLKSVSEVWNQSLARLQPDGKATPAPIGDKRFAGQAWLENPAAAYSAQMYLLNARALMQLTESVQGDEKTKGRIRFAVQQWVDAASPSNYLAFNPEALKKAMTTQGESIANGIRLLLDDVRKGHVSQTDESVFEVGRNVATTEGTVVFENELFQLIEYKPLTATRSSRVIALSWSAGAIRTKAWSTRPGTTTSSMARSAPSARCRTSPAMHAPTCWASVSAAPSSPPHWQCWRLAVSNRHGH